MIEQPAGLSAATVPGILTAPAMNQLLKSKRIDELVEAQVEGN